MTVKFSLLLWCTNPAALDALSQPESFQVDFLRGDLFGLDVLDPHNSARKNRHLSRLKEGRIWRTDDGPPAPGSAPARRRESDGVQKGHRKADYAAWGKAASLTVLKRSGMAPTRMMELYNELTMEEGQDAPAKKGWLYDPKATVVASTSSVQGLLANGTEGTMSVLSVSTVAQSTEDLPGLPVLTANAGVDPVSQMIAVTQTVAPALASNADSGERRGGAE
jgi:hypothetical protein